MKLNIFSILFLLLPLALAAQEKPAYTIFSSDGKKVEYEKMIKTITQGEVIFFGELHNNPIAHWLELQVAQRLYENNHNLVLSMEMFEADDQVVLDEYLHGTIEEKHFLKEAKTWDNFKTDYRPLIEFAREKKLDVIAANIPRRYANLVYRKGIEALDTLSAESKKWIAPLPIEIDLTLKSYRDMMTGMGTHGGGNAANLAKSQAVKDATMAYFIAQHKQNQNVVLHINGAYHSQDHEGVVWYIKKKNPALRVVTIHVAEQLDLKKLDPETVGKADFIVVVDEQMTKSYWVFL